MAFEKMSAFPDRLEHAVGGSAAFHGLHDDVDDFIPLFFFHQLVDAFVSENADAPLEKGEEDQDAGALARLENLFIEKGQRGTFVHPLLFHGVGNESASQGGDELSCESADAEGDDGDEGDFRDTEGNPPVRPEIDDGKNKQHEKAREGCAPQPGLGIAVGLSDDEGDDFARRLAFRFLDGIGDAFLVFFREQGFWLDHDGSGTGCGMPEKYLSHCPHTNRDYME